MQQADRASADDHDVVAETDLGVAMGLDHAGERLGKGSFLKRNIIRYHPQLRARRDAVAGEAAAHAMLEVFAIVEHPAATLKAHATHLPPIGYYSLADLDRRPRAIA